MQEIGSGREKGKGERTTSVRIRRKSDAGNITNTIGVWAVYHLELVGVNATTATNRIRRYVWCRMPTHRFQQRTSTPATAAAASSLPPLFAISSAEAERGAPRDSLRAESRANNQGTVGGNNNAGSAWCPPPPPSLSKEARGPAREEERISNKSFDPAISTDSPGEAVLRPGHAIAFPAAMVRESDYPSPAGRNGKSAQQHQQHRSEFYFNLGRRMMLDSIGE